MESENPVMHPETERLDSAAQKLGLSLIDFLGKEIAGKEEYKGLGEVSLMLLAMNHASRGVLISFDDFMNRDRDEGSEIR